MKYAATCLAIVSLLALSCLAQTSSSTPDSRAVLRLRVRVKIGEATRDTGVPRKRFFLVKGTLEQNKTLLDAVAQRALVSRDCYYRRLGASSQLIKWLRDGDCESVYCREIQTRDLEGAEAVPEFTAALVTAQQELGSRELAQKWLTNYVVEHLRDGFYKTRQQDLKTMLDKAEAASGSVVLSVMTDRNGTAYFTDLKPGAYVVSNLVPTEIGSTAITWTCEVQVKAGDIATEKPFLISNRKDRNVKCVGEEKPLPVCD